MCQDGCIFNLKTKEIGHMLKTIKTSKEKDNTVYFLTLICGLPNETLG